MTEMPRKVSVSKPPSFVRDDENDTQLFDRWQELVLQHCPNPERIGCFDHETLRTFVENPSALDLTDPKYIHVTECAECTRELQQLRLLREERLRQASTQERRLISLRLRWAGAIAASVAIVAVLAFLSWKHHAGIASDLTQDVAEVPATVDLSADGLSRDANEDSDEHVISLPRRLVRLHLVLPYYSPIGNYRITVTPDRNGDAIKAEAASSAAAHGSRTELEVKLNLRRIAPGKYYLGTSLEGDGAPYYYPLTLKP